MVKQESDNQFENKNVSFTNAVKWAYVLKWGQQLSNIVFVFILARLLGPKDYGIVGIAMVFIAFLQNVLLEQGLNSAIIQRKNLKEEHLDSAFWLMIGVGIALVIVSIVVGPIYSRINKSAEFVNVLLALSFIIPIRSLSIVQEAILHKSMQYRLLSIRTNISVILGGCIGVFMAFSNMGVWSLVGQKLSTEFFSVILLWSLSKWRPKFRISIVYIRELATFSGGVVIGKFASFTTKYVDSLLMGIYFGPVAVGLYRCANNVLQSFEQFAIRSIHIVSLPEFSRHQSDPKELKKSIERCLKASSTIAFPIMAVIIVCSDSLISILGDKWNGAASPLRFFSVIGILHSFTLYNGPLLLAKGKTYVRAMILWIMAIVSTTIFFLAGYLLKNNDVYTQVNGMAISRVIAYLCILSPISIAVLNKFGGLKVRRFIVIIFPSLMSFTTCVIVGTLIQHTPFYRDIITIPIISLGVVALPSAVASYTVLYITDSSARQIFWSIVKKYTGSRKRTHQSGNELNGTQ